MADSNEQAARLHALEQQMSRFGEIISRVNRRAVATRSAGFRVPIVDADPDPDDPTNDWIFDDGRRRWRGSDGVVHEVIPTADVPTSIVTLSSNSAADAAGLQGYRHGPSDEWRVKRADGTWARYPSVTATAGGDGGGGSAGSGSSSKPKQPDPKPKRFTRTYDVPWARSFCPRHGVETKKPLYYGDSTYSRSHGFRRIMLGLNDAAIRSDLNGATIRQVEFHMVNQHAHYNGGVVIHLGAHNSSSPAGGFGAVRRNAWKGHWPKVGSGDYWRTLPKWFGRALRDNNIKGLVIWQPGPSNAFYGAMNPDSIRLRIHYTK